MNSVTIFAIVRTAAQLRYVGDSQKPVAEFAVNVPALKESQAEMPVRCQAWGQISEQAKDLQEGQPVLLIGRTEINSVDTQAGHKEQRATFIVTSIVECAAPGTNVINLVGRLAADPETKFFESGSQITEFRIAVDRRSRNNNEPDWFSVEAWGKTAEVVVNYLRKGSQVGITGSIKWDLWDDRQTGAKRSKPIIRVDALTLLGSKRDSQQSDRYDDGFGDDDFAPVAAPKAKPTKAATPAVEPDYNDIPF